MINSKTLQNLHPYFLEKRAAIQLIWRPQKVLHTQWPGIYSPNASLVNFYYDSYHNISSWQSFMSYNLQRMCLKSATVGNLIVFELSSILGSFWKHIRFVRIRWSFIDVFKWLVVFKIMSWLYEHSTRNF